MKTLLLFAASLAALNAAEKIVGGPFVVNATSRTATVVWLVESDGLTYSATGVETRRSPSIRVEKTTLNALRANTRYEYDVAGQDAGKGSFKTAPAGAEPYNFVVYGDTRTRHDVHRKVMQTLVKHGIPDFVMHTGDLVADGADTSLWPIFFDIEKDLLRQAAFFPALGNHEHNSHDYFDYFQGSPYYSFDWGNGHLIVLNTDIGNAAIGERAKRDFWNEQTHWLEEDLASHQKSDFLFVFGHHPPMTAVARRQGDNPHMMALMPMFEKYHVSAADGRKLDEFDLHAAGAEVAG